MLWCALELLTGIEAKLFFWHFDDTCPFPLSNSLLTLLHLHNLSQTLP